MKLIIVVMETILHQNVIIGLDGTHMTTQVELVIGSFWMITLNNTEYVKNPLPWWLEL